MADLDTSYERISERKYAILHATIHKYEQAALNQTGTATRHQKARRVIATSGDDFRYNRTRPLPPGYKAINGLGELHERPRQLATLKT